MTFVGRRCPYSRSTPDSLPSSVAFVQRRVPHYREAFFGALQEQLRERDITLDVIVADVGGTAPTVDPDGKPWLRNVAGRRVAVAGREVIWQGALRATARHDLVITELSARIASNLLLMLRSRAGGPLVGGFGHGRNLASAKTPGPRSAHGALVRSVDWWFAYNDLSRDIVTGLGFPASCVTSVNNTIDTRRLKAAVDAARRERAAALRDRLGIGSAPVALYCGALYRGKRLGFVFDAAVRLRRDIPDLALIVMGDGPCEDEVRAFAGAHDWVHYVGRVVGLDRAPYFAISDVMLMPGLVGLVLLDSFAAQVPLVTTDSPFHGPEIAYLRHAENGWRSNDTLDDYVASASLILRDQDLRRHLSAGCAEAAERYPLEKMVTRFCDGIAGALAKR